jgi:hypothetical protein
MRCPSDDRSFSVQEQRGPFGWGSYEENNLLKRKMTYHLVSRMLLTSRTLMGASCTTDVEQSYHIITVFFDGKRSEG